MIEIADYIAGLDQNQPTNSDALREGDDHLRLLKKVVLQSFPNVSGPVTAGHIELSRIAGLLSPVQGQLDTKAPLVSPAFTGVPTTPTAPSGTSTQQLASTEFVSGALALAVAAGGVIDWTAGSYPDRAVRRDPTNGIVYAKVGAGSSTQPPSLEGAAWVAINRSLPLVIVSTATSVALRSTAHVLVGPMQQTLQCPATPAEGDYFEVVVVSARQDTEIGRNGATIMGIADDLTINMRYAFVGFAYANGSWRVR